MKREDMELMFAEVVGIVWGLSHETNFNVKKFNNMANEIQNRYLGSSNHGFPLFKEKEVQNGI